VNQPAGVPWQLDEDDGDDCVWDDGIHSDDDSVPSTVTINELSSIITPDSPQNANANQRKPSDDCHVLVRWSELQNLVREQMACVTCGTAVTSFHRRTVGIATKLEFNCALCDRTSTATALRSKYVLEATEKEDDANFLSRQSRVDSYELNWRLILATQLLGESQVGGSIIALFLDLTREAFRNAWSPMEAHVGLVQARIGKRIAAYNLKLETMGKVAILCDGVAKYPCSVSYDMGWQKASRTYDSLSGQGLMIGERTNRVVAYHNYSKACSVCESHSRLMKKLETPDVPVVGFQY
jgi:hypothetical protein